MSLEEDVVRVYRDGKRNGGIDELLAAVETLRAMQPACREPSRQLDACTCWNGIQSAITVLLDRAIALVDA